MSEQKNLVLAVALSLGVMFGYNYFFAAPTAKKEEAVQQTQQTQTGAVPLKEETRLLTISKEEALQQSKRQAFEAPSVKGTLNLETGMCDDLELKNYKLTPDLNSSKVVLFSPKDTKNAYLPEISYKISASTVKPTLFTVISTESFEKGTKLTLKASLDQTVDLKREIIIDENYLFTITDTLENKGSQNVSISSQALLRLRGTPQTGGNYILHEGFVGIFNSKLEEYDYKKVQEKGIIQHQTTGGWLGLTDKYWLGAFIPDQKTPINAFIKFDKVQDEDIYEAGYITPDQTIEASKTTTLTYHLFAGAKVLNLLDAYEAKLGFDRFDLAVDFGWFYFITKPLFFALSWLNGLLGNFGLAIIALTILVKGVLFPLANKSYRNMSRMKNLTPKIEAVKKRFEHDKMKLNQELMELYKKEKVNPVSGCLPMLIQFPVFFALYKVFFVTIEMRHAPFYGWIHDLSATDPTNVFNLFGLIPFDPSQYISFLHLGLWPLIMGATMVLQQKLSPQPGDPMQAKMFLIMPVMFTFLFASFPAGLVIYWVVNNILSIAQQWGIMRLEDAKSVPTPANKGK
ncbi:MAG TPA: membrane protein insertase YidC [Alphaproteobacteria bacterium]|nr:membrane protein insertase YidC [Alphaproteobacteria bacterium]